MGLELKQQAAFLCAGPCAAVPTYSAHWMEGVLVRVCMHACVCMCVCTLVLLVRNSENLDFMSPPNLGF
jgi:hypothetical protein